MIALNQVEIVPQATLPTDSMELVHPPTPQGVIRQQLGEQREGLDHTGANHMRFEINILQ
tara:strand:+ start:333 stop:512 length:180 start_codon:yes stop_codon:yes gene_type:complete